MGGSWAGGRQLHLHCGDIACGDVYTVVATLRGKI